MSDAWTSEYVGIAPSRSRQWRAYRLLARTLDYPTALSLLAHPKPAVRVWAAQYFVEHVAGEAHRIESLLRDHATLRTQTGCVVREEEVATVVVRMLASSPRAEPILASVAVTESYPPALRAEAARGLGPKYASLVRPVVVALLGVPGDHHAAALDAFRSAQVVDVTAIVEPFAASDVPEIRVAAAGALASSGDARALALLIALAKDADPFVREAAVGSFVAAEPATASMAKTLVDAARSAPDSFGTSGIACAAAKAGTVAALRWIDANSALDVSHWLPDRSGPIASALRARLATLSPSIVAASTSGPPVPTAAAEALEYLARVALAEDAAVARPFLASADESERYRAAEVLLVVGDVADGRAVLAFAGPELQERAAERLLRFRDWGALAHVDRVAAEIRAAAQTRSDITLDEIADEIEPDAKASVPRAPSGSTSVAIEVDGCEPRRRVADALERARPRLAVCATKVLRSHAQNRVAADLRLHRDEGGFATFPYGTYPDFAESVSLSRCAESAFESLPIPSLGGSSCQVHVRAGTAK
jgi:hypothetical protein